MGEPPDDGSEDDVLELDVNRLVRRGDPRTSIEAAMKASKASKKAIKAVAYLMQDGNPRIDEEVWQGCRANRFISSLSTIQHGRLALSEGGVLVETGTTRQTTNNSPSREWVCSPEHLGQLVALTNALPSTSLLISKTRIDELRAMDYRTGYLASPEWSVRRVAALKRAEYECELCGSKQDLNVRHKRYTSLGEEKAIDLVVLCHDCNVRNFGVFLGADLAVRGGKYGS